MAALECYLLASTILALAWIISAKWSPWKRVAKRFHSNGERRHVLPPKRKFERFEEGANLETINDL
jgi:hypothetical protein